MRIRTILFATILLPLAAVILSAQPSTPPSIIPITPEPTAGGSCTGSPIPDRQYTANGHLYTCTGGVWVLIASGATGTVTTVSGACGISVANGTTTPAVSETVATAAHNGSYAILTGDCGKSLTTNTAAAWTIAQAGTTGFETGKFWVVNNIGSGSLTVTATTSTFYGGPTANISGSVLTVPANTSAEIISAGANYQVLSGGGGSPSGAAGGDLSGTYPNPTVSKIEGGSIPVSSGISTNASGQLVAAVPCTATITSNAIGAINLATCGASSVPGTGINVALTTGTGNVSSWTNPTNPQNGQYYAVYTTSDSTGGYTLACPSSFNICPPLAQEASTNNTWLYQYQSADSTFHLISATNSSGHGLCSQVSAPITPIAGVGYPFCNSTNASYSYKNPAGTVSNTIPDTAADSGAPLDAITSGVATKGKVVLTQPATAATITIANNKTLTANNSLTLAGTDSTTQTFPGTSQTIPGLGQANTWTTGVQDFTATQLKYAPQAPTFSDTDAICAATAGSPACPSGGFIPTSGTTEAAFVQVIAIPQNVPAANRAMRVVFDLAEGSTASPTITFKAYACLTANFTSGNTPTCSSGGVTLLTSSVAAPGTTSGNVFPQRIQCDIVGAGSGVLYTTCQNSMGQNFLNTSNTTKQTFSGMTSGAWTFYLTAKWSAGTAGNWIQILDTTAEYIY